MVAACCCFPQSVNGGGFLKAALMPLKPHTPDRSRGLNGWPSTLYFTFPSALSLLFWHRGHCFHPSGAGTETGAWAVATTGKARAATNTRMEIMVCFRIWKSSFLSGDIRGILQRKGNVHKKHKNLCLLWFVSFCRAKHIAISCLFRLRFTQRFCSQGYV